MEDKAKICLNANPATIDAVDDFRCTITPPPSRSAVIDFLAYEALTNGDRTALAHRFVEKFGTRRVRS